MLQKMTSVMVGHKFTIEKRSKETKKCCVVEVANNNVFSSCFFVTAAARDRSGGGGGASRVLAQGAKIKGAVAAVLL